MSDAVTLEFLAKQIERVLAEQASLREDMHVLTSIVLRHDTSLAAIAEQLRNMVAQHARFNDRLRRLEERPAE